MSEHRSMVMRRIVKPDNVEVRIHIYPDLQNNLLEVSMQAENHNEQLPEEVLDFLHEYITCKAITEAIEDLIGWHTIYGFYAPHHKDFYIYAIFNEYAGRNPYLPMSVVNKIAKGLNCKFYKKRMRDYKDWV